MSFNTIKFFAEYNTKANKIITDAFPSREFAHTVFPCLYFGTPLATVNHIAGVTDLWLARLYGDSTTAKTYFRLYAKHPPGPTQTTEGERWTELEPDVGKAVEWLNSISREAERRAMLESAEFFAKKVTYLRTDETEATVVAGAGWMHLCNHNTHHRGQLHAALCEAGVRGVVLDMPAVVDVNELR